MIIELRTDALGHMHAEEALGLTDMGADYPASMVRVDDRWWEGYVELRRQFTAAQDQLRDMLDVRWKGLPSLLAQTAVIRQRQGAVVPRMTYSRPRIQTNRRTPAEIELAEKEEAVLL